MGIIEAAKLADRRIGSREELLERELEMLRITSMREGVETLLSGNFPGHATTPVRMVRTGEAQERPC